MLNESSAECSHYYSRVRLEWQIICVPFLSIIFTFISFIGIDSSSAGAAKYGTRWYIRSAEQLEGRIDNAHLPTHIGKTLSAEIVIPLNDEPRLCATCFLESQVNNAVAIYKLWRILGCNSNDVLWPKSD